MGGVVSLNWMAKVHTNSAALPKSVNVLTKIETTAWNGKLAKSLGAGQRNIKGG
jgi:hypothetical protein